MDLTVWLAPTGLPTGFQFCYGKGDRNKALTWRPEIGFSHPRSMMAITMGVEASGHRFSVGRRRWVCRQSLDSSLRLASSCRRTSVVSPSRDWRPWTTGVLQCSPRSRTGKSFGHVAFNRGDLEALKALFAPDAEVQGVLGADVIDKAAAIWAQLIDGLGIKLTIEELVAEGDCVVARYTERGVFKGSFMGHEPTGRTYELVAMEWFVIRDGKIVQRWRARDAASQA